MVNIFLSLILVLLLIIFINCSRESFESKPTEKQMKIFGEQIIDNKKLFNKSFYDTRGEMPWIDAITYEDVRSLISKNKFNKDNVKLLFI